MQLRTSDTQQWLLMANQVASRISKKLMKERVGRKNLEINESLRNWNKWRGIWQQYGEDCEEDIWYLNQNFIRNDQTVILLI